MENHSTVTRRVDRRDDSVAGMGCPTELPVTLALNELDYATALVTPEGLEDWAFGFAFSEGLITRQADVGKVTVERLRHGYLVRLRVDERLARLGAEQHRVGASMSSCGRCGTASEALMMQGLQRLPESPLLGTTCIDKALARLRSERSPGLHLALALDVEGNFLARATDIGRHNALDKLIGQHLRQQSPMPSLVMLSSRCSLELVQKVVRAGIPALATLAVPSTLAVDTARLCRLQLFHCHRGERIDVISG